MRLSIREKIMLLALGIAAIIFFGLQLLIFPSMNKLTTDKSNSLALQPKLVEAQLNLMSANSVDTNIKKAYDSALTEATPLLPSLDKPSIQIWLFGIATNSGLKVQSATFGDPNPTAAPAANSLASDNSTSSTGSASNNDAGTNYLMKTFADQYLGKSSSATPSTTTSSTAATSTVSTSASEVMMSTVTLQMSGSYSSIKSFLDAIHDTKRYVIITSLDCSKSTTGYIFNVTLNCYAAEKLDKSDNLFDWAFPTPSGQSDLMKP